jgi:hypothetical protein
MNEKNRFSALLENSKLQLSKIVMQRRLQDTDVTILVKPLTPEEAIGKPGRRDFPIIEGKERVIEAQVLGTKGHAFTDSPGEFVGKLAQILDFPLTTNKNRAIYVATLNAVLRHLDLCEKTVHCKDDEPIKCAKEIASHISKKRGNVKVGLIGLNPAIAESLIQTFKPENVKITDLNKQNINSIKWGVLIWDGREMTERLIEQSDMILTTGTTLINATFDHIMNCIRDYNKNYLIYGVTCAGICKLMQFNRICPYARSY